MRWKSASMSLLAALCGLSISKRRGRRFRMSRREASRRAKAWRTVETLETRIVLSTVTWVNPAGGNWSVPANWSTDALPGSGDDVVINQAGSPTITMDVSSVSVHSVTSSDPFVVAAGKTLTVTAGASQFTGSLTVGSNSTLKATNAGTTLTASGTTNVDGSNIIASGGATLSLPSLTSYSYLGNFGLTVQATGTGSVLNLSSLTSVTGTTCTGSPRCDAVLPRRTRVCSTKSRTCSLTSELFDYAGAHRSRGLGAIFSFCGGRISLRSPPWRDAYVNIDDSEPRVAFWPSEWPSGHRRGDVNGIALVDRYQLGQVNTIPHFVRRSSVKRCVRASLVVPILILIDVSLQRDRIASFKNR
jgi:hypothetical protein